MSNSSLRVLVTGTASGIGRAVAQRLTDDGDHVHGIDLNASRLEDSPNGSFVAHLGDVTSVEDWERVAKEARSEMGGVDALVNVAGINFTTTVEKTSLEDWQRVLSVNLTSVFIGVKTLLADLRQSQGSIVIVSSVLGVAGRENYAAYSASKGGLIALARSLAVELGSSGVRVNCVCPGPIDTPMLDVSGDGTAEEELATTERRTVLGRIGRAEEVAGAIRYLLSVDASYVTGAVLPVDGGRLAK